MVTKNLLAALLICGATLPSLAAESGMNLPSQHYVETVGTNGTIVIDWSEGVVRVTGSGTPPDMGDLPQRRLMAERKASADAYRQLAEAIYGIRVNSETIVRDYVVESETIKSYVNALIKGAQKMDQRYLPNGTVEVDMSVKIYSNTGLSGVLQPQKHVVPPPPVTLEGAKEPGEYSGVIVDCRGLGLEAAMSPAILSQAGGELYLGHLEVKPEYVINKGVVGYARSLEQARQNERIGDNPLIIKGTRATGTHHTDVEISEVDTKQLVALEKMQGLLKDAKVIFVL